jgi:transposase
MSDLEWEFIKAVLPNNTRGVKRVNDRRVINGIFYVLKTGVSWRDLPAEFGPRTTVYNRFNRWSYAGIWDRIMEAVADAHNVDTVMVDSTSVRVHHAAATLKKTTLGAAWGDPEVD